MGIRSLQNANQANQRSSECVSLCRFVPRKVVFGAIRSKPRVSLPFFVFFLQFFVCASAASSLLQWPLINKLDWIISAHRRISKLKSFAAVAAVVFAMNKRLFIVQIRISKDTRRRPITEKCPNNLSRLRNFRTEGCVSVFSSSLS